MRRLRAEMKNKCAMCGEIKECDYYFGRDPPALGYKIRFCPECGSKIKHWLIEQKAEG